jgi:hypothetical protein
VVKTQWVNVITGERLDRASLAVLRHKAHRAYEANTHIFEDEMDALSAFGVMPADEFEHPTLALAVA